MGGRICLITGAASGLGRSLAFAAAARGASLVLTDIADAGLEQTVTQVRDRSGTVLFAQTADLRDYEAVSQLAERVHSELASVQIVMNVAGASVWGPIERLDHEHWKRMVDINLMGPIHVIETFVPPMIDAGHGGHLVNVSSAAGLFGFPWHAAYSASKFGVRGVSEVLRFDLRRHGIGVSVVVPGAVATPLMDTVDIIGVDRDNPRARHATRLFRMHAVSAESAAGSIIRGVERDRYWIYTSWDIRLGHWAQRIFPPPYDMAMRGLNWATTLLEDPPKAAHQSDEPAMT
jgi:NAD(P)-dependent dehydrogenase (short-subunit alcohol dehydrogenase family)